MTMLGVLALSGVLYALAVVFAVVFGLYLFLAYGTGLVMLLMSPFWTPDQSVRTQVWIGVNIVATLVLLAFLSLYNVGLYLWFVRNPYGMGVFVVGLPVLVGLTVRVFMSKHSAAATIWLAFAAFVFLGVGYYAIKDAHTLRYKARVPQSTPSVFLNAAQFTALEREISTMTIAGDPDYGFGGLRVSQLSCRDCSSGGTVRVFLYRPGLAFLSFESVLIDKKGHARPTLTPQP